MFLSIIIPVYKVEQYLRECIDSIINQKAACLFEVIAIDDGSPDNCGKILDEYSNLFENIHVIHQNNQGLSAARNSGIDKAIGDYLWFVDSDDWIEPFAISEIHKALQAKPDILQIGFKYVWSDYEKEHLQYTWKGSISGCSAYLNDGIAVPAQFTIVRKSLITENSLKFLPGILHEDTEYKPKLAIVAKSAACLSKPIYNYRQREQGSITSYFSIRNAQDLIIGCNSIINFALSRTLNKIEQEVIGNAIGANLNHLINRLAHYNGHDRKSILKLLKDNKDIFKWLKKANKRKYKFEAIAVKLNFRIAIYLIQFLQLHK